MLSPMEECRWINAPAEAGASAIETEALEALVGFPVKRIFWLTRIVQGQWRGRHAHRKSKLATFAVVGSCRMTLDNGEQKETVALNQYGPGLIVGPWIWHDLFDFSEPAVILVAASTLYDEKEYLRDYDIFVQEARTRRKQNKSER